MPDWSALPETLSGQLVLTGVALAALALFSGVMDHRHTRRKDLDRIGLMPWGRLSVLLLFGAIVTLAIALRAG